MFLKGFFIGINPRYSFGTRLGLAVGSVALTLSVLLSLLVGYTTSQRLQADTGRFFSELAYQMADKLDRGMFERYRDVQIVASLETFRNQDSIPELQRGLLEKLQSTYSDYAWIGWVNLQGKVLVSTGKILEGQDVSKRPWFINGKQAPYVGDVHQALMLAKILPPNPNGEPLRFVDITAVVKDLQNRPTGVLGAHLSWNWAKKVQDSVLRTLQQRNHVEMLVLSKEGYVLLSSSNLKGKLLGEKLNSFQTATKGKNDYLLETWQDGRKYLTGFAPCSGYLDYPGLGWVVLVRQNVNTAFAPARTLQKQVLIWGAILGLISATLSWLIAKRIVYPIMAISTAANRLTSGSSTCKIPVFEGKDEVALLSKSLNNLVTTLNRQTTELEILNEELEQRVKERTIQLEATNKELEAFSCSVSHDLRAPLTRIQNFSQILIENYTDNSNTNAIDCVNRIVKSSQHMGSMIESLLRLARLSQSEMYYQQVDLSSLAQSISQELLLSQPNRQVEFHIAEGVIVKGDRQALNSVLENLLGNAWKYTSKHSTAFIEFGVMATEQHISTYFVRDDGAGFDMSQANLLFKPFQRMHSASQFLGNGIGLATVQRIIHRHGGKIWAEAAVEQGATFYFTLKT